MIWLLLLGKTENTHQLFFFYAVGQFFQADLPVCNPEGRACYENIKSQRSVCSDLPRPCQGYYADVRLSPYKSNSEVTKDDPRFKRMILDYEKYKGVMVGTEWPIHIENITEDNNVESKRALISLI